MQIATVTATKDGETLEDNSDVSRPDLCNLLQYADEITVHEIHDEEVVEDVKARYSSPSVDGEYDNRWAEKVTVETDADAPECVHADCDADATQIAHCDTGQKKAYCGDHAGGDRAGIARVDEWVSIEGA